MFCLGFLTEKRLAREAERYGDAGINPQVVWANGTLASAAAGIAIDLLTDWTRSLREPVYPGYDGNKGTLSTPQRMQYLKDINCKHYPIAEVGDPIF
jgi:molybdopterin-synthase adenylyltransferase